MGMYQHVRELWKKPQANMPELWRERLLLWRREPVTLKIEYPTRIDRARSLGYKAKQGYIIVRQKVNRGGHTRQDVDGGRKSRNQGIRLSLRKNFQLIAEERAQKKFENLVILNSYWVAQDGKNVWYEIILVDPHHPVIKADSKINWICAPRNLSRVFHGKTSAGRKVRGLRWKGEGVEHARPSRRANLRRQ